MDPLTAIPVLLVIHFYLGLALLLLVLSAGDLWCLWRAGVDCLKRHRGLKWMVATVMMLTTLAILAGGLFVVGMAHGSRPSDSEVLLFVAGCLVLLLLWIFWAIGNRWLSGLWLVLLVAGSGYLVAWQPALYVEPWADAGFSSAQLWMARHHESGQGGLRQSASLARRWYQRAADEGEVQAQFWMALQARRPSQALKWHRLAAAQGHLVSMTQLVRLEQDEAARASWLAQAAARGEPEALFLQAELLQTTDLPGARELMLRAAKRGSRSAMLQLVDEYRQGGVLFAPDAEAANDWQGRLLQAPALLSEPAQLTTDWIERKLEESRARGERQNQAEAALLFEQAQAFLRHPANDPLLLARATELLQRAANAGHAAAALEMARLWMRQRDLARPDSEALHWYQLAATGGERKALEVLTDHYKMDQEASAGDLQRSLEYNRQLLEMLPAVSASRERLARQHWAGEYRDTERRLAQLTRLGGSWASARDKATADPAAEYRLAKELLKDRQFEVGMRHLESAASRGNADARLERATRILRGPRSYDQEIQALSDLQALARERHLPASLELAKFYQSGTGIVPRNYYLARALLRRAEGTADYQAQARRWLARIPDLTDTLQVDGAEPLTQVDAWYQALQGSDVDKRLLEQQYRVLRDHFSDTQTLKREALAGNAQSQYRLAQTLQSHDLGEALRWLQQAAAGGSQEARYELAVRMLRGKRNSAEQQAQLQRWAMAAAEAGHVGAMLFVAAQHRAGRGGFASDSALAKQYYLQALEAAEGEILFEGWVAGKPFRISRSQVEKVVAALDPGRS